MTTRRITCISMNRSRAEAAMQRRLDLQVGGTCTEFEVSDGAHIMTIEAWGATPGARATVAKVCFAARKVHDADSWVYGAQCAAHVRAVRTIPDTLESTWRWEEAADRWE